MQPIDAKQIPAEQKIFNSAWMIVKCYHGISERTSDDEMEKLKRDLLEIHKSGTNQSNAVDQLARNMTYTLIHYLDALSAENS